MRESPPSIETALQLAQARELMAQGQPEKAMALALGALQGALYHLKEALARLQHNLAQAMAALPPQDPGARKPAAAASADPPHKPRIYH
jgi:hypothetical protein